MLKEVGRIREQMSSGKGDMDIKSGSTVKPVSMGDWGAQWLSGRGLDSSPKDRGFEPHRHQCVVSLSKTH